LVEGPVPRAPETFDGVVVRHATVHILRILESVLRIQMFNSRIQNKKNGLKRGDFVPIRARRRHERHMSKNLNQVVVRIQ